MNRKIIGVTVGSPLPKPNLMQNDPQKGDYVKGKEEFLEQINTPGSGGNVEPMEDDIPKVFFCGALPQTKDDTVMTFRYISKTRDISGYCKTKAQGNSSMAHPKKNQTVKLYADAECTEKLKVDFKGWGRQNKFCLKANWIDLTHARNVVSARLWGDVVKTRANYMEIPELLRTSPNHGAVDGFPVKVYADGIYQGRYTLNIPKDAWMANMDDELDTHCILCGENYVSGCFRAEANIDESDWSDEVHETVPPSIKDRWNEVIRFVMNSTDEEFVAGIGNYFDVNSLIDYYLYGVIICNNDGFGKNQLYMTYDGQKWYATAYDVDNTFGLYLGGILAVDFARTAFEDYKNSNGNLLYVRLESLFIEEIKARYAELKSGALSLTNIINRFERFTDITPMELVEEDYAETTADGMFTGIPLKDQSNIQQIRNHIAKRYAYVDGYIDKLGEIMPEHAIVWNDNHCVNSGNGEVGDSERESASEFIDLQGAKKMLIFSTDKQNWLLSDSRAVFYDADQNHVGHRSYYDLLDVDNSIPENAVYVRFNTQKDYTYNFTYVTDVYDGGFTALPSYTFVSSKIPSASGIVDAGNTIGFFDESIAVAPGDIFYWYNCFKTSYTGNATVYDDRALYGFDANGNFVSNITALTNGCNGSIVYIIPEGIASVKVGAHNTAKELISYKVIGENNEDKILYQLPAETTFDGVDDYIDTGVKLFDEPKSFTIVADLPSPTEATKDTCVLSSFNWGTAENNWAFSGGICLRVYPWDDANGWEVIGVPMNDGAQVFRWDCNERIKIAIVFENGSPVMGYSRKVSDSTVGAQNPANTYTVMQNENLLIGVSGTRSGKFYDGTIHSLTIYGKALTGEEVAEKLA